MNTYLITEPTTNIGKKIIAEIIKKQEKVSFIFPVRDADKARKDLFHHIYGAKDTNMVFYECPEGMEDATLDKFSFRLNLTQIIACPLEFEDDNKITIIDKTRKMNKSAMNIMELAKKYHPRNVIYLLKKDEDDDLNQAIQFAVHYCKLYEKVYGIKNIYLEMEDRKVFDAIL